MEIIYFIRHIGMSPIKIGRTNNLAHRLSALKNASPYGIEVLGVIETDDSINLESLLHKKFKPFRLYGEWFSIDERVILDNILMYKSKEYIDSKNEFELYSIKPKRNFFEIDATKEYSPSTGHIVERVLNIYEIRRFFNIENKDVKDIMTQMGFTYKSHRVKGKVKAGYKLYTLV